MELLSNENVNIYKRKKLGERYLASNNKTNYETLKSDSFKLSNNNIKNSEKTKNKLQGKTKELLSSDSNNNDGNNNNYYFSKNIGNQTIKLNKKKSPFKLQQDINHEIYTSTATVNDLKSILTLKMIVNSNNTNHNNNSNFNSFHIGQSVRNFKKKIKKLKKKKTTDVTNRNEEREIISYLEKSSKEVIDFNLLKLNESIRWENELNNKHDEEKRIELYKLNRRKRYIEQRNSFLKTKPINEIVIDSALSSSSSCSIEKSNLKNFKNDLENIIEIEKSINFTNKEQIYENNFRLDKRQEINVSNCSLVKRDKQTDSAISSISSNSQMFY
ncbi:unnamed protein product [Brachionus calyciflorus]|uniref:Uncharacterized protein n=1 Tax=Brachionus calyciflorus TaxID=104777 RepID=A0A813MB77_9BILA|nr:unnamed protein product [Brachionus calyciflorus]